MSKTQERFEVIARLQKLGFDYETANKLRRISLTLNRWFEMECGTENGCIERDEKTGKPRFLNCRARYLDPHDPRAWSIIPDREAGARKRLAAIMAPHKRKLVPYIQGDCRGASLYILRKSDVKPGEDLDSIYTRGTAVY